VVAGVAGLAAVGRGIVSPRLSTSPADQAVLLSQGVSEAMNVGALGLVVAVASATVWLVARWRLRVAQRTHR
jgi:hypothetical protein